MKILPFAILRRVTIKLSSLVTMANAFQNCGDAISTMIVETIQMNLLITAEISLAQ
jgi:hypothetical protein